MKKPEILRQTARARVVTQINRFIAATCAAIALCFALNSQAVNILSNPGFDATPGYTGWSYVTTEGWTPFVFSSLVLSPPNSMAIAGEYGNNGAGNTYIVSVYQQLAAAPGYTYSASAWFSQYVSNAAPEGGLDGIGSSLFANNNATYTVGGSAAYYEDGWVEVQFLSSTNVGVGTNVLADYKSGILNPALVHNLASGGAITVSGTNVYLNWFQVPVTNVYNPATIVHNGDPDPATVATLTSPGPTNSIPSGVMTAPAGTKYVQFSLNVCQTSYASGVGQWDNCDLEQLSGFVASSIGNITPSGSTLFNIANTNFTFNVTSSAGTTVATNAIQVVENGVNVSGSLGFSGTGTNWLVTLPGLSSNTIYTMSISVNNSAGLQSTASTIFDTFDPNDFVVPAEDYNFGGGQFIQNPIPTNNTAANSYWGLPGISGTDYDILSGGALLPPTQGSDLLPFILDAKIPTRLGRWPAILICHCTLHKAMPRSIT